MLRKTVVEIVILAAIGAALAFIGPFGSYALPLATRLAYWIAVVLLGFPLFRASRIVAGWLADTSHIPVALAMLVTIALAAVPMTFIVALFFYWDFAVPVPIKWSELGTIFLQVWIIAALVSGATRLIFARQNSDRPTVTDSVLAQPMMPNATPTTEDSASHRLDLPPGFGSVLALQSEDHYVRVHGESLAGKERSHLLLMRLRDAIGMMPPESGLQVHRSWWVAKDAVSSHERDGRAAALVLTNGLRVPVSRDNMAAVRAANLV